MHIKIFVHVRKNRKVVHTYLRRKWEKKKEKLEITI
jgi:ribosomal protein L39E